MNRFLLSNWIDLGLRFGIVCCESLYLIRGGGRVEHDFFDRNTHEEKLNHQLLGMDRMVGYVIGRNDKDSSEKGKISKQILRWVDESREIHGYVRHSCQKLRFHVGIRRRCCNDLLRSAEDRINHSLPVHRVENMCRWSKRIASIHDDRKREEEDCYCGHLCPMLLHWFKVV